MIDIFFFKAYSWQVLIVGLDNEIVLLKKVLMEKLKADTQKP